MIAIIDYKAGNLTSVRLALEYIGVECEITSDPARILAAERVIFPGVGAAARGHAQPARAGAGRDRSRTVVARGTPFLGICLGTQIIFEFSEEDGGTPLHRPRAGQRASGSRPTDPMCKIPQMGWNAVEFARPHPLLRGHRGRQRVLLRAQLLPRAVGCELHRGRDRLRRTCGSPRSSAGAICSPRSSTPSGPAGSA